MFPEYERFKAKTGGLEFLGLYVQMQNAKCSGGG